jgi:hypothetical protein
MWYHMGLVRADVSEERMTRVGEPEIALVMTRKLNSHSMTALHGQPCGNRCLTTSLHSDMRLIPSAEASPLQMYSLNIYTFTRNATEARRGLTWPVQASAYSEGGTFVHLSLNKYLCCGEL